MRKAILISPRYLDDLKRIEAEETAWKPRGTSPWMFRASTFAQWLKEHLSEFPMNGSKNGKNVRSDDVWHLRF